jgi:hypothetical protein
MMYFLINSYDNKAENQVGTKFHGKESPLNIKGELLNHVLEEVLLSPAFQHAVRDSYS